MSILIDERSKVIVQGVTGKIGRGFAARMARHHRSFVGGVTPGRGGQCVADRPVWNTVAEAVREAGADTSVLTVPAPLLQEAVLEALDAGIRVLCAYTDRVPTRVTLELIEYARLYDAHLIGPNAVGAVSPGKANASEISEDSVPLRAGSIGVASRSGSITYELIERLSLAGYGQSTVVCIGGDAVVGTTYQDVLELFAADPGTRAIVMLGEVGGDDEIRAVDAIRSCGKPVVSYVAGRAAPPGRQMGHAGAIVRSATDTAAHKEAALARLGVHVAQVITDVVPRLSERIHPDFPPPSRSTR